MIPQLYLRQSIENLVDWDAPFDQLSFHSLKLATGEARLLLEQRPGYLFIGRRKERRDAQRALSSDLMA